MTNATAEKEDVAQGELRVFRNPKQMIYYLKRRPDQQDKETNFALGPGMSVKALDYAEDKLLEASGLIDVAKETPLIGNSMAELQRALATERSKNDLLRKETEELKAQAAKANKRKDPEPEPEPEPVEETKPEAAPVSKKKSSRSR